MYNENEKKRLSNTTILLLKRFIKDIKADRTNTASSLLKLNAFVDVAFNDHEKCKTMMTLITAGMWSMFDKEVMR